MEYIYAAMLIHKAGGKIDEPTVKKVMQAAGASADDARVKALVAALTGVNIDEAIQKAAVAPVAAAAPAAGGGAAGEAKKEDKKKAAEEEKKTEEAASAGLGALFG
ncbi:50S ribosomal protein P1 [Candidatus Woesearchaeota archaeon]|nr:50S ribosomal protein P1 [Candidatus Woesearchaeota archaeon]